MADGRQLKGQCLCGAIKITANNAESEVGACHCNSCRRWGGGPFMEINCGSDVEFEGAEYIAVYHSSDWAERGFCRQCGSHLFYRLKEPLQHMMPVGLFEEDDSRVFRTQVFIDEKPAYYSFAEKTDDMTGAELFAKYAPPE